MHELWTYVIEVLVEVVEVEDYASKSTYHDFSFFLSLQFIINCIYLKIVESPIVINRYTFPIYHYYIILILYYFEIIKPFS